MVVAAIAGALATVPPNPNGSANGPAPRSWREQPAPTAGLPVLVPGVQRASSQVAPSVHAPCGVPTSFRRTATELTEERSTSLHPVARTLQSAARAATPMAYFARGRSLMSGGDLSLARKASRFTKPAGGTPPASWGPSDPHAGPGNTPISYQTIFAATSPGTSS